MTFLTIVSTPKPFTDPHIATIQRNAIQSWLHLGQEVEVLLIGEEAGMAEVARELGVRQIAEVARNAQGTPLVSSIFDLSRQASRSPVLVYVNADILFMPDLLNAAQQVAGQLDKFLMIGQRWDLEIREVLNYSTDWAVRLQERIRSQGMLHPGSGSDYFVFRRDSFTEIPPFAVGRAGWDNWMIYYARKCGWPVVDATKAVVIAHQDHDYSHLPGGRPHYDQEESEQNRFLAGGKAGMFLLIDADARLEGGRVRPFPPSLARLLRKMELAILAQHPRPAGLRRVLVRWLRRAWRRLNRMQNPAWNTGAKPESFIPDED